MVFYQADHNDGETGEADVARIVSDAVGGYEAAGAYEGGDVRDAVDVYEAGDAGVTGNTRVIRIAAIVMASGFSRRLGTNKLLLPLGSDMVAGDNVVVGEDATTGKGTVIERVLDQVARLLYDTVAVVSQYDLILEMAEARGFMPVANPNAAEGKSSSIRLGIEALEKATEAYGRALPDGIIFLTGDQALLSDRLLAELTATFRKYPDKIIFPVYDGKYGSPAIFPVDVVPRLKLLKGEEGGMAAAREQKHRILPVKAEPAWQGLDIDTPEAWEEVKVRM